jgi:hypothetical protein
LLAEMARDRRNAGHEIRRSRQQPQSRLMAHCRE